MSTEHNQIHFLIYLISILLCSPFGELPGILNGSEYAACILIRTNGASPLSVFFTDMPRQFEGMNEEL